MYYGERKILNSRPIPLSLEKNNDPRLLSSPLKFPGKLAIDVLNNRLFISDSNHNRIVYPLSLSLSLSFTHTHTHTHTLAQQYNSGLHILPGSDCRNESVVGTYCQFSSINSHTFIDHHHELLEKH